MSVIAAGLIAAGSQLATNIWSAREAASNRAFQERMSSTAHQREMLDLRKAGIHPAIRGLGGAQASAGSVPQLEDAGSKGVSSALAAKLANLQVRQAEAAIDKTKAESDLIRRTTPGEDVFMDNPDGSKSRVSYGFALAQRAGSELARLRAETDRTSVDAQRARRELEELFPQLIDKAKAEIDALGASARAQRAAAMLDELRKNREVNMSEFEEALGTASPTVRLLLEIMRAVPSVSNRTINPTTIIRNR